ncbi:MAG TPA: alpha/beta hydrolase, partial [Anaeromyxobacter sp.]|nr:alpha/beta hydrolase [Anaeromyxobacter sp.]
ELPETVEPIVVPLPPHAGPGFERLVAAVREKLPVQRRYALLAESFSGPMAIRFASERPADLVALVLVATFHRSPVSPWLAALRPLASVLLSRPPPAWATRHLLAGNDALDDLVRDFREAVRETAPAVLAARIRTALDADEAGALAACRVPILYVGGARDRLLRSAIPNELKTLQLALELEVLDAPHLVLQRQPMESARVVSRFLERAKEPNLAREPRSSAAPTCDSVGR